MISMSVSVDVPNMADGVRFYTEAFGFSKMSEPIPGVVVLRAGTSEICLLEKKSGSVPAPGAQEARRYAGKMRVIPVNSYRQALHALATLR